MKKKLIITILVAALVIGLLSGGTFLYRRHQKNANPIKVYSVSMINSGGMGYDSHSMNGNITVSSSQNVYIEKDQIVKEVYASEGDAVKAGDKLMLLDMTKQELDLESDKATLEEYNTDLIVLKGELDELYNVTPVPDNAENYKSPAEERLEKAEAAFNEAEEKLAEVEANNPEESEDYIKADTLKNFGDTYLSDENAPKQEDFQDEATYQAVLTYRAALKENIDADIKTAEDNYKTLKDKYDADHKTAEDIFNAAKDEKEEASKAVEEEYKNNQDKKTYTKTELAEAIKEKEKAVESKKLAIRKQEILVKQSETKVDKGTIVATMDGTITKVDLSNENIADGKPVITISGTTGYQAILNVDEWNLVNIKIGDSVNIMNYDNGMNYEGKVIDIGLSPVDNYYSSGDVSYYPVTVSINAAAEDNIYPGQWIEATFDTSSSDNGDEEICLLLPFVKKENGNSYVMVNENGYLKKKYVKTGKTYWGYCIEIKSGLSMEDEIAFPYLKDAVEGKKCVLSDNLDEIYK